jgi:hypothetical protein
MFIRVDAGNLGVADSDHVIALTNPRRIRRGAPSQPQQHHPVSRVDELDARLGEFSSAFTEQSVREDRPGLS